MSFFTRNMKLWDNNSRGVCLVAPKGRFLWYLNIYEYYLVSAVAGKATVRPDQDLIEGPLAGNTKTVRE